MPRSQRKQKRNHSQHKGTFRGTKSFFLVFGALLLVTAAVVQAQSFVVPSGPAPDNTADLNVFTTDTGDFIELGKTTAQTINGSLVIASSTQSSAIIGDYARNVSLSGFSGFTAVPFTPPDLPAGVPGAAVYGYAKGSALSVGAYGYAVGASATDAGVFATTQSGTSASFLGPVKITSSGSLPGSLYMTGALTVPHRCVSAPCATFDSSNSAIPGLESAENGTLIKGMFTEGLYGQSAGEYGIYGVSTKTDSIGFYSLNNSNASSGGQNRYGVTGTSNDPGNSAGVYGYVNNDNGGTGGNGVAGISGTGVYSWAVYGKATADLCKDPPDDKVCSAGVYGDGGAYAGYFEGDLKIDNGGNQNGAAFFLGSSGMTETVLCNLIKWCGTSCPDAYYTDSPPC